VGETRFGNSALLGKLIWHLMNSPEKLWVGVVIHKYMRMHDLFHLPDQLLTSS
jgi:hypothetical protein